MHINQKKAYLYAGLSVLFWGTIGSAFKLTLWYLSFIELLLYSSLVSVIVLFLVLVIQKKIHLIIQSSIRNLGHSALLGLLNPFLYYFVLLQAYDMLKAQEAAALNYIWPVVLTLLSIPLLKQKIRWVSIGAILISFSGTVVIATKGEFSSLHFENPVGVGLALGSAIFWSLFWIFNVRDHRDEVIKLFFNMIFGFVYTLITAWFLGKIQAPPIPGIAGAVYIGIFEMGITFVFWLKALKLSETTAKVTNLIFIAPFLSLIIISFAVGEKIMYSTFVGLIFIMSGIAMQNFGVNKKSSTFIPLFCRKMLKPIKLSLRKYLFNKELQHRRRKVRLITLERAATIGIIYNLFSEDDFRVMSRFIKKLQEQGKKVKAIAYNGGKIVPPYYNETLTQDLILEKQLSRLSFPKVPFVTEFIETQFDILFDFSMEYNFPGFFLGALSVAGFKIGLNEDNRIPYFDLLITPENNSTLERHIESTLIYLEQIKPVIK